MTNDTTQQIIDLVEAAKALIKAREASQYYGPQQSDACRGFAYARYREQTKNPYTILAMHERMEELERKFEASADQCLETASKHLDLAGKYAEAVDRAIQLEAENRTLRKEAT